MGDISSLFGHGDHIRWFSELLTALYQGLLLAGLRVLVLRMESELMLYAIP